jgi:tetratricopeptide (TPR) repeat protein
MTKENILFTIVGLLLGLIVGFMFANNVNQKALVTAPAATMKQNPNMPEGHPDISGMNQPALSMPQVQEAMDKAKQEPNNFDAQVKAAEMNYQIEAYDKAAEFLKQANKLKPDDYPTIVNLGNVTFDGGNYTEAEKWYSSALEVKPDDENVRTDLGLTFMFRQQPNYDRAIKEFEQVLAKNVNHPQDLQNLTVAYTKKGNTAKATETVEKLESVDPTNVSIAKLKEEIKKLETK